MTRIPFKFNLSVKFRVPCGANNNIMAKKKETYSQAMARLETIVRQVDSNELEIDELVEKIKEAKEIFAFCSEKLKKADTEIEKLLADKQESEE